jgi:hypothetical protein
MLGTATVLLLLKLQLLLLLHQWWRAGRKRSNIMLEGSPEAQFHDNAKMPHKIKHSMEPNHGRMWSLRALVHQPQTQRFPLPNLGIMKIQDFDRHVPSTGMKGVFSAYNLGKRSLPHQADKSIPPQYQR